LGQGSTGVFTHTTKNVLGGYLAVPYITATANTTVSESTQEVDVIGTSGIITLTFDNTSNLLGSAAKTVTVRNRGAFDVTLSRGSQSWEWSDMTGTNTTTNKTLAAGEQATMFWIDAGVTDYYVLHKIPATFSGGGGGISSLNALTGATQTFATGTSGSNFNISSVGTTHTFNIPDADLGTRGLVTASPQIIDGKKTFVGNIEVGDVGSTEGQIGIASSFGTTVTLTTSPSSGTWSMTLPTGAGSNGQVMTTNGSGVTSWTSVSGDITNGGNSTGAAVTIGTNDNNALNLETNGVPRLSISSGASTGGVLTATNVTSNTNTVQDALVIQTNSSGTAATNFGSGILFQGESTTTDNRDIARISSLWSQATDASREGRISFQLGDNGGALTEVMSINRSAAASGGMVLGTSNPLTVTEASFTVGGNYVFGNASGQVTLGGSTGAIVVNNTSTGPITIHNSVNAATSTAGISIGSTTNFTQTSGTRNYMNFPYSFSPTSGTASHRQLVFSGTFNQTGGANGITNSIRISPTITAVADYRALEIRANGNNVRGIYQTGPNVRNYLYGKTYFGDTIVTPTAQVTKLASASVHTNRYHEAKDMQKTASHITTEPVEPDDSKHFYALGNRYPMPDASYVKQASNYFEQYEREFHDAEDRHVFAANVLARAEELSVSLDNKEKLSKYAGEEYGDLLESQLKLRQELLWHKPEMAASLDKLAANKSGTEPLVFAKVLNSFDKHAGLSKYHGRAIADAYQSTFERRFTKTASGYSWEDESTGLTITEKELEKVADEKYSKIKGYFGSSVADQLKKHAVSIFESLPINAKEVIVKIAKGQV